VEDGGSGGKPGQVQGARSLTSVQSREGGFQRSYIKEDRTLQDTATLTN
jgi:hypothetical protein